MKLAEALQIRADLQRRLAQMPSRLSNNATVQEGSRTTEDPYELMKECDSLFGELENLTLKINLTNSMTRDDEGNTITALIARRDTLKAKADMLRDFLRLAGNLTPRHSSTDIRILPTVNVPELRKKCDALSKQLREVDVRIQGMNWNSDLIE